MKKKLSILLTVSVLSTIIFSFISGDIHYTNLLANFAVPLLPSVLITLLVELVKTVVKKGYKFNNICTLFYNVWLVFNILFIIGTTFSYYR